MVLVAEMMTEDGREVEEIQHALRGSRLPSYRLAKNVARQVRPLPPRAPLSPASPSLSRLSLSPPPPSLPRLSLSPPPLPLPPRAPLSLVRPVFSRAAQGLTPHPLSLLGFRFVTAWRRGQKAR